MTDASPDDDVVAAGEKWMGEEYVRFARYGGARRAVRRIVTLLGEGKPILVHCFAGKDRTGFGVAVLLQAAGLDQDAVMADYLQSNAAIPQLRVQIMEMIASRFDDGMPTEAAEFTEARLSDEVLGVRPEYLEAALETVPAEHREALYRGTQAAIEQSFDCCFPMRGKWGEPKVKQLPFATPLADVQSSKFWGQPVGVLHDYDEQGNVVFPPPVDPAEVAARQARVAELKQRLAARRRQEALGPRPAAGILSPKTPETTEFNATTSAATEIPSPADGNLELVIALVERTIDDECPETWRDTEELDHPDAQDPDIRLRLLSERLERHRRKERRQARAADKKAKAARKRAQAQRRRAG